jgi:hypothetical protein
MFLPPPYTRRGTHRTPHETAERGSRALRGLEERQTRVQGRVRRRRRGGTTMPGSWCLPGGPPDAAVEEEEARAPAEGIEGGGRGGGGGLEAGTNRRRCGARARERGTTLSSEIASIAAPSALARRSPAHAREGEHHKTHRRQANPFETARQAGGKINPERNEEQQGDEMRVRARSWFLPGAEGGGATSARRQDREVTFASARVSNEERAVTAV